MDTLIKIREQWEEDYVAVCVLVHNSSTNYKTYLVVLEAKEKHVKALSIYRLHRYFKVGDQWHCSIDVDWTADPDGVFDVLTTRFEDLY